MNFLRLTTTQLATATNNSNEIYTPVYDGVSQSHYIYRDTYTSVELPDVYNLSQTQLDGLTPIDPTKPMFPKRP